MTMKVCVNYSKLWKSLLTCWCVFNIFTIVMLGWNVITASVTGNIYDDTIKECFTDMFTHDKICWHGFGYFQVPFALDFVCGVITFSWIWYHYNSKHKWIVFSWCEQPKTDQVK